MKKYLKNSEGMALPMVLVIMTIIMTLATATAIMAYNSFVSVRWMHNEKQAYYLGRAGVEAASYAYQEAISQGSSSTVGSNLNNFVKVGENGGDEAIINSQRVYVYYTKSAGSQSNTKWDGFEFTLDATKQTSDGYFGYFDVQIGNGEDLIRVQDADAPEGYVENPTPVKVFKCTAVVGGGTGDSHEMTRVVYGYIAPAETVGETILYDADGYLSREASVFSDVSEETIYYETLDSSININSGDGILTRLGKIVRGIFNGFMNQVYKQLSVATDGDGNKLFPDIPGNRVIKMYSKTSNADLILPKPTNSKVIKGQHVNDRATRATGDYGDNFYVIASAGNVFLQDVGIDTTPDKGQYNCIGLYGDNIIIDGNITLYAYITNPDSLFGTALTQTVAMLGNRFRLGTVMLGHGTVETDDLYRGTNVTNEHGNSVPANKVFFNGNVVLKVYTQGVGTETYRIFNAGDMAYFYGSFGEDTTTTHTSAGTVESNAAGIDLLKYFCDAVIDGRDGYHIYGDSVVEKCEKIREIYYGSDTESYFEGDTCLFERLQLTMDNYGHVYVNGETGRIDEIIQPMPSDASTIQWGIPKNGDVFH